MQYSKKEIESHALIRMINTIFSVFIRIKDQIEYEFNDRGFREGRSNINRSFMLEQAIDKRLASTTYTHIVIHLTKVCYLR